MFKQYKLKNYRFRLVAYVVLLCIIGVMVVGSAKQSVQNKQIIGIAGGLVLRADRFTDRLWYDSEIPASYISAGCCIACRDIYSGSRR